MKKNCLYVTFLALISILSSCATVLNSKQVNLKIITSEPSNLVFQKDTIKNLSTDKYITVNRDNKPLTLTVYNDSVAKTVVIKPRNSFAYWLNIYPNYVLWAGFYIDTKTKKRYTYPSATYIDFAVKDNSYLSYEPLDSVYRKYQNIFKTTPLKIVGITNPAIELSYERKTGRSYSTQLMASYLLPMSLLDISSKFNPDIKGYKVGIEEKFYIKKSAPIGTYISAEVSYLNNKYYHNSLFTVQGSPDGFKDYDDLFEVRKQNLSFNFKVGHQIIKKRLSLDFFAGLGLRYKNVKHFGRANPEDELATTRHFNFFEITNREGKYWAISMPLNIKIGRTF